MQYRREVRFDETPAPSMRDACATQNPAVARIARFESKIHLNVALVLLRRAGRIERNIGDRLARLYQFVFD